MVKPGITGWAQINYPYGASLEDARHKLEYDLYYAKNYTPFLDMLILLQTVRVLLWPDGRALMRREPADRPVEPCARRAPVRRAGVWQMRAPGGGGARRPFVVAPSRRPPVGAAGRRHRGPTTSVAARRRRARPRLARLHARALRREPATPAAAGDHLALSGRAVIAPRRRDRVARHCVACRRARSPTRSLRRGVLLRMTSRSARWCSSTISTPPPRPSALGHPPADDRAGGDVGYDLNLYTVAYLGRAWPPSCSRCAAC